MKKVINVFSMAAIVLSLGFTSCSKEDPSSPVNINLQRTATIKGKILIQKDFYTSDPKWSTPESPEFTKSKVVATIDYSELATNASGTYVIPSENITYESSTGNITIIAPVAVGGSSVRVKIADFEGRIISYADKTINVIWKPGYRYSSMALPGETVYLDNWYLSYYDYDDVVSKDDKILY